MADEPKKGGVIYKGIVLLASLVIVIAGLKAARMIVVPVMLSLFVAITLSPLVSWLTRRRIPRPLAILLVLGVILVLGAGTGIVAAGAFETMTRRLPFYAERLTIEMAALIHWAQGLGIDMPEKGILGLINPGAALSIAADLLREFGAALASTFLILLFAMLMLLEASELPGRIHRAYAMEENRFAWFEAFTANLYRYLVIKTIFSLATGIGAGAWLWFLGVDFPVLWGLLTFLLNYAPTIGTIMAAIPVVLLALIQLGWGSALLVVLGYLALKLLLGTILEPRFLGQELGMPMLLVFLSMLFWGWVLGYMGIFLAIPLTMTVIIALKSHPDTERIAVFLGPRERA
ncbi:MAG: AI-2E family transporter [Acidobacteriota bacterium]|jgi:predicted PurR-regulated permease PerM|nr:AI-2E family transporter [Acidobacteriota bacterium]NLT32010.1 AI-2E family transporter [Acidobacteriota bacterium]